VAIAVKACSRASTKTLTDQMRDSPTFQKQQKQTNLNKNAKIKRLLQTNHAQ